MLVEVCLNDESHQALLYKLLTERYEADCVNIEGSSLDELPSIVSYLRWLEANRPEFFYFWLENGDPCALVFLRKLDSEYEIGVFVLKGKQKQGIGKRAVNAILQKHPLYPIVARINPRNQSSIRLFESLDFRSVSIEYKHYGPTI